MPPKGKGSLVPTADDIVLTKKLIEDLELKKLTREEKRRDVKTKRATILRQQKVVDVLSKERDSLEDSLNVMQSPRICVTEQEQTKEVTMLFDHGDIIDKEIKQEKKHIEDLEAQIYKASTQLERHRKNTKSNVLLSDFRLMEKNRRADRLKSSLESKLNAEQVQLNTVIKENTDMRQKIKLLLKEKNQFNKLYEEMIQKLNRGKTILADVVKQSKAQCTNRDEMARKIQVLKKRDNADLEKRQEEMQDLVMKLNEDKSLALFRQRIMKVRDNLDDVGRGATKSENLRNQHEKHLGELTGLWNDLSKETGQTEFEEVRNYVLKLNQDTFSLFNYNNELRYQLEAVTEKTAELMKEVEDGQDLAFSQEDQEERLIAKMKYDLSCIQEEENDMRDSYEASCRLFDRLLSKVRTLFDMLKCDVWPLEQLLGDNKELNQHNYKLYLNLVESQLIKLMSFVSAGQEKTLPMSDKISEQSYQPGKTLATLRSITVVDKKFITRACPDCEALKRRC